MTFWGKIFGLYGDYYIVQVGNRFHGGANWTGTTFVSLVKVRDEGETGIRQQSDQKGSTQPSVRENSD